MKRLAIGEPFLRLRRDDAARHFGGTGKPQSPRHGTSGLCLGLFASPALAKMSLAVLLVHAQILLTSFGRFCLPASSFCFGVEL